MIDWVLGGEEDNGRPMSYKWIHLLQGPRWVAGIWLRGHRLRHVHLILTKEKVRYRPLAQSLRVKCFCRTLHPKTFNCIYRNLFCPPPSTTYVRCCKILHQCFAFHVGVWNIVDATRTWTIYWQVFTGQIFGQTSIMREQLNSSCRTALINQGNWQLK